MTAPDTSDGSRPRRSVVGAAREAVAAGSPRTSGRDAVSKTCGASARWLLVAMFAAGVAHASPPDPGRFVLAQAGADTRGGAGRTASPGDARSGVRRDPSSTTYAAPDDVATRDLERLTLSELDADGDGEVSPAEAADAPFVSDDLFDFIDSNHDGRLSQFELEAYRQQKRNDATRDTGLR